MNILKMPADLPEAILNPNAEVVLQKRYLKKGLDGKPIESPKEMFWRVASGIASMEENYPNSSWKAEELARTFYTMMTQYDFLPNSPTLMNAGTETRKNSPMCVWIWRKFLPDGWSPGAASGSSPTTACSGGGCSFLIRI